MKNNLKKSDLTNISPRITTSEVLVNAAPDDFILTLETVGLPEQYGFEIVYISLSYFSKTLNNGKPIVASPIRPFYHTDISSSTPYNGITNEMVKNAPKLGITTAKKIAALTKGHKVFVWNKDFIQSAINTSSLEFETLIDVQEEARWDLLIPNPNERPDLYSEPQYPPKLPSWQDVLGRKPANAEEKIQFIRFTQTAMQNGGIEFILKKMKDKSKVA